ncbi:MAG TPA: ferritin family protein [Thermodesulfobacteriota bacterium]|nr:ferritin family protein [Thermodesulfobacteriota bacterium]
MPFEHLEEKEAVMKAALIEINGYRFYSHLADTVEDRETKEALKKLARDEKKHLKVIETVFFPEAGFSEQITEEELAMEESMEKTGEADIFTRRVNVEGLVRVLDSPRRALILALDTERYSVEFFEGLAEKSTAPEERDVCQRLADEEKNHVRIIEGMLEKTPKD